MWVDDNAHFLDGHAIGFGFFCSGQALKLVFEIKRETPHDSERWISLAGPCQAHHKRRGADIEAFDFGRADA